MRTRYILFAFVQLLVVLLIMFVGVLFTLTPYAHSLRAYLIEQLSHSPYFFQKLGGAIIGVGLVMLLGFYRLNGRRYYHIKLHCQQVEIDKAIIQGYVKEYWEKNFPALAEAPEVIVRAKNQLEILAPMPKGEPDDEGLFKRLENELGVLLGRLLGYEDEFYLTLVEKD